MTSLTRRQCPMYANQPSTFQQKRRDAALERQRKSREAKLEELRLMDLQSGATRPLQMVNDSGVDSTEEESLSKRMETSLVMDESNDAAVDDGGDNWGTNSAVVMHRKEFMHPEWMVEIPADLQEKWVVVPRPEGVRCLVTTTGKYTISRKKTGILLHHFHSALPGGSRTTEASAHQSSVLDCIFQEQGQVYYVMDVLQWRGMWLTDCAADFRLYWIEQKLTEDMPTNIPHKNFKYRFELVRHHPCTPQGITAAVHGVVNFQRDGVVLIHKDGLYVPGNTPLMLLWKDASCSRYFLETDGEGNLPSHQVITLAYDGFGGGITEDEPPISFGKVIDGASSPEVAMWKKGKLMKFAVDCQGFTMSAGQVKGMNLTFLGLGNQRKGRADTISKILFQYWARLGQVRFDNLITAIESSSGARDVGEYDDNMESMQ